MTVVSGWKWKVSSSFAPYWPGSGSLTALGPYIFPAAFGVASLCYVIRLLVRRAFAKAVGYKELHDTKLERMIEFTYNDEFTDLEARLATRANAADHPPLPYNFDRARQLLELADLAYKAPPHKVEHGNWCRTCNIWGLPTITILDPILEKKLFEGFLRVEIHRANNLRPVRGGTANPMAEVFTAACSFRSKVKYGTLDPIWDDGKKHERHWLYIRNGEYDSLVVRVVDHDRGEDLGVAVLGLHGLISKPFKKRDFKLPLRGSACENSTITLSCCFYPNTDEIARMLAAGVTPEEFEAEKKLFCDYQRIKELPRKNWWRWMLNLVDKIKPQKPTPAEETELDLEHVRKLGYEAIAFVNCGLTDTQAWLFRRSELGANELVVSFRGTETDRWMDLVTDIRFKPEVFQTILGGAHETENGSDIKVHRGFYRAYKSVRRLLTTLIMNTTTAEEGSQWDIHVTGHSLGGALATLGAYELALHKKSIQIKNLTLHTFGSPRVGNDKFKESFDHLLAAAWRFTNPWDIVPTIPPQRWFSYSHVGQAVRMPWVSKKDGSQEAKRLKADNDPDTNWVLAMFSCCGVAHHNLEEYKKTLEARGKTAPPAGRQVQVQVIASSSNSAVGATAGGRQVRGQTAPVAVSKAD
ncbi:hypothetical protein PLESTF_000190900 [Pleodorina starrii]|nr:hypothetical protein PLESTF_000190900 [Pleodorina starrii]